MMLEEVWNDLQRESAPISSSGTLRRQVQRAGSCKISLGMKHPSRCRCLLVESSTSAIPSMISELCDTKGYSISLIPQRSRGTLEQFELVITSSSPDYNQIFGKMAEDIITSIHSLYSDSAVLRAYVDRVQLWQHFFERQSLDGLSRNEQVGLFGELLFIEDYLLAQSESLFERVKWVGSDMRQHDFQGKDVQIEVKTTTGKKPFTVTISSEQQLDDPPSGKLFLFFRAISPVEDSSATLPSLIDRVRARLSDRPGLLARFNGELIKRGYLDTQKSLYESFGYATRSHQAFLVEDGFPRICESKMPLGVGDVKYSLAIDACRKYQVSDQDFLNFLEEVPEQ